MAHLVDIAEWVVVLAAPTYFDQHFVTNSPAWTGALVVAVWVLLALVGRVRRPWPYVLAAVAVFSHLLLDHHLMRRAIADTYQPAAGAEEVPLSESVFAEVWLYGLLLVLALLARAAWQKDCPRKGRAAAGVFAVAAIFAAITRHPAVWMPAYALAAAHALLLMRRDMKFRLLWSLVPIVPIFALLGMELYAGALGKQADAFWREADYDRAGVLYQRALEVPTRSRNLPARVYLSLCQRRQGDLKGAEETLRYAIRIAEDPAWPRFILVELYLGPDTTGTPQHRPEEAARLLRKIADGPSIEHHKMLARQQLDELRRTGVIE